MLATHLRFGTLADVTAIEGHASPSLNNESGHHSACHAACAIRRVC